MLWQSLHVRVALCILLCRVLHVSAPALHARPSAAPLTCTGCADVRLRDCGRLRSMPGCRHVVSALRLHMSAPLCVSKGQQRGDALRCARSDRLAEAGASARGSSFWSRTRDAVAHARHASLSLKSRAHAPAGAHRCEPGRSRSVLCSAECRLIPGRGLSGLPWGAGDRAGRGGRSRG